MHRHLVGGVEHSRGCFTLATGFVSQTQARESFGVGHLKFQALQLLPVNPSESLREPCGIGDGVADAEAHVGQGKLSDRGAVYELNHGMDDGLRMDDHFNPAVVQAEQLVGFNDLQAFVHERGGVDCDLRPHAPSGVRQGVFYGYIGQIFACAASERAAAGGEHDAADLILAVGAAGWAGWAGALLGVLRVIYPVWLRGMLSLGGIGPQALMYGAVFAVYWQQFGARRFAHALHQRPGCY